MDNFSFEDAIRVAVLGPLEFIKGVQWEINKRSTRKVELFQWRAGEQAPPLQIQGFLYFVEHGSQVPVQTLKTLPKVAFLAVFESMNPSQVLGLGQVAAMRLTSWEEGRFDKIASLLMEELNAKGSTPSEAKILSQLKNWLKEQGESPTRLVWTNCPTTWNGAKEITIPSSGAPLVIGSLESTADFKLPLSGKGEWALLQKNKLGMQFRSLLPQLPVQFFGDPSQLKVGDRLRIFDFSFELSGSNELNSLKTFMRRQGVSPEDAAATPHTTSARTLADTIRELLESGASGELSVRSENRVGYLSIQEGYIDEALVGPVSGLKALFRIMSWPDAKSQFDRYDRAMSFATSLRLGPLEFQKAYDRWKQKVQSLKAVWPPLQLKVKPDPMSYQQKKIWTVKDFLVYSSLCESDRVFELLNNCPLLDLEIVESLVGLRKDGLVLIHP